METAAAIRKVRSLRVGQYTKIWVCTQACHQQTVTLKRNVSYGESSFMHGHAL